MVGLFFYLFSLLPLTKKLDMIYFTCRNEVGEKMGKIRKLIEPKRDRWLRYPYLCCMAICLFSFSNAYAVEIDLSKIRSIESSNNPHAVSPKGCIGLYQISRSVLSEYNRFHNTSYTPSSLLEVSINERIAVWYLTKRIPAMLRYYKKPITVENILWAYNSGIGNLVRGIKPLETINYIKKYERGN